MLIYILSFSVNKAEKSLFFSSPLNVFIFLENVDASNKIKITVRNIKNELASALPKPDNIEATIFIAAFVGSLIGFLWYNTYPAQVFMGDTGSLTIGGIIAVLAIAVRKELLIPILAGVFFIETLSVILQVSFFKYTKKKNGEGKRIFKMSPLHHHYQKSGYHESKIVTRFWIVGIMLAVLTIVTLKLR